MDKLPLNWCECCIKDIANIQTGKLDANAAVENGIYPFFTCALEPLRINTFSFDENCIYLPGNGANVGYVGYYQGKFDAYQRTYVLDKIAINERYLYFSILLNWKNYNKDKQFGVATNFIRLGNLENYPINFPPLAEQERIVEKIEEIFAKIDAGVEKLKSAQEKIKQYKQSVLHSAFTGKLYKTTEWKELPLNDVCKIILGQSPDSQTYNDDGIGLPFFQGKADFTNMYPIVKHYCSQFSKIAEINDILLSVRAPVGAVNISNCKCCIGRGLAALREIKDVSLYKFIYYLIKFKENELHKRETGTTFKAITGDRLKTVPISLPTLSEQERIVEEIEKMFAKADKMLEVIEKSIKFAEQLKQSVLKKAFEGKLVPQDPNDEPASVLLERIKSEKQQNEKAKGKKK